MGSSLTALRERLNDGDRRLLDRLNTTTSELATLALQGRGSTPFPEYRQHLAALEEQRGSLEADASERSAEFRARSQPVTLAGVQALIPPEAALLEIRRLRAASIRKRATDAAAHGELRYVAYVDPHQGDVRVSDLGAAKDIDRRGRAIPRGAARSANGSGAARARPRPDRDGAGRGLLGGGVTRLLLSPDGALNLVPFEAFVDADQRYLIERYAITYLTTGRDLLRLQVARPSKARRSSSPTRSFGEPAAAELTTARTRPPQRRRRSVVTADSLASVYFAPLAGTGDEARAIKSLFPDATLLTGAQRHQGRARGAWRRPASSTSRRTASFSGPNAPVDNPLHSIRSGAERREPPARRGRTRHPDGARSVEPEPVGHEARHALGLRYRRRRDQER